MSLGPTFVQSASGLWYRNPIVGLADWFICWDEDEPIELVRKDGAMPAVEILAHLAMEKWLLRFYNNRNVRGHRFAGRIFDGLMLPATAHFLTQVLSGPPDNLITSHNGVFKEHPHMEGTYYVSGPNGWGDKKPRRRDRRRY